MSVRTKTLRLLRVGQLTPASRMEDIPYVGPYLARRLTRAFGGPQISDLWTAGARMQTHTLERTLHRALQNKKGNQCTNGYHVADINYKGYESLAAVLEFYRSVARVRYGALPASLTKRSASSKRCACLSPCVHPCILVNGACVPRSPRTAGFPGVYPQEGQVVRNTSRRRVLNSSRTRINNNALRDTDTLHDLRAGHARSVRYVEKESNFWRVPSAKIRLPLRVAR